MILSISLNQISISLALFFFNTSHSYCEAGDYPKPFQPTRGRCNRIELGGPLAKSHPELYFNRYRNALHYVDSLIGKTLKILAKQNMLDNTIVILTGDHGEEFNDNHKDYWGHTSNFSNVQLQTPLIVHWPRKQTQHFRYMTSHYDIVPTLIHEALGYTNPTSDYALGQSLFSDAPRTPFYRWQLFTCRDPQPKHHHRNPPYWRVFAL